MKTAMDEVTVGFIVLIAMALIGLVLGIYSLLKGRRK
jgi:hypothetical protein